MYEPIKDEIFFRKSCTICLTSDRWIDGYLFVASYLTNCLPNFKFRTNVVLD